MKIFVFGTRGFPLIQGGVEKHCENLYPLFPEKYHFTIFRRKSYVVSDYKYPGITFIDLPSTRIKGVEAFIHSFICSIITIIKHPDIVHIHNIGPGIFAPLIRLFGIKVVLTYHSPNYEHKKWNWIAKKLLKMSESIALQFSNAIIFVNKFQMEKYSEKINRKSRYIPNGINVSKSDNTDYLTKLGLESQKYILAVGRITPEKGFEFLVDAFNKLSIHDYKLVIAGGVENESNYYKKLLKRVNPEIIIFTGFISGDPLSQLYCNAGLFILPSLNEGFPLVLLEAMGYGCEVLVSDIPATHLVQLDKEDYFIAGNVDDLCLKLKKRLVESKHNNRNYELTNFSWQQITLNVQKVYNEISREKYDKS